MGLHHTRKPRLKTLTALGFALGLSLSMPAFAETPASSAGTAIAIMQATSAMQSGDCAGALKPLNQLWHDPYLEQTDPELAAQFRFQLVACTADTQGLPAALALSTENMARAKDISAYDLHVFLQLASQQPLAAAATLEAAMARFPDQGPKLTDTTVVGVLLQIHDSQPAMTQSLLNHLEDTRWQIHNVTGRPLMGYLRLQGLRAAVKAGDTVHAALYRTDLKTDSMFYIVSQGDGAISDAGVASDSIGPVLLREIEDVKAVITANPADLMALSYLMELEKMNGQDALALTQLNGILALVDQYGIDKFGSAHVYPDLLAERGALYANVGRFNDAGKAFEEGATKLGAGKANAVLVAYMKFLVDNGREREALALEGRIDIAALDGGQAATVLATEACAMGYAGDTATFGRFIGLLNGRDLLQVKPYLCAGNSDAAAKALISAISNPAVRDDVIFDLQNDLPPIAIGNRDETFVTALEALKARADVQAAAKANTIIVRNWTVRMN